MSNNPPLVIVLSRNYSTGLSVIRSLGAAGYTVDLVASASRKGGSNIAACSKYVRSSVELVSKTVKGHGSSDLLDALKAYIGTTEQPPVLFPTDDYTTSVIDQNRDFLREHFLMPTILGGGSGCMTELMNKSVQGRMAREAGLPVPKEWVISLAQNLQLPEDVVYPCFCKPIESISGYKAEMAICEDQQQLLSHLRKLKQKTPNRSVLVQEFLKIDGEIDLSGVCLDQEIIIPAIIRKQAVARHEKGVTLAGQVVPFSELGEIQEQVIAMLQKFHYIGMFDMEFNIVGGKLYFNEVNLRSGGPNFSYFASGVNLPALFVKELCGQRHTPEEAVISQYGKTFVYEKVAWEDYIHGFLTKKELKQRIASADITLLENADDPAPSALFHRQIQLSLGKYRLKKIRAFAKKLLIPIKSTLHPLKQTILGYPQAKPANRRNPDSPVPRVIVSGRNYCSNLCMARSLGQAGYEVEVLQIFQQRKKLFNFRNVLRPDSFSKYVKSYEVCYTSHRAIAIVNQLLKMADPQRKMLLVPVDDLVADVADTYYDLLSPHYILPNVDGTQGKIGYLMSKGVQKELALAAGLPVVNSCVIHTANGHFTIPESVTYPCFIKPNISKNSSKSRMRRCDSRQELEDTLREFSVKKDIQMLVEDYLEISKEYAMLGLSTKDGVVAPGFFVAEEGGHNERRGVAMTGKVLPCSQQQELIDDIIRFVSTLGFEGLFDVDLIETADGRLYFTELNLRFGASGYAITESGVNLPGMYADYVLQGKPIDLACQITQPGKHFLSEKVMLDEFTYGLLTERDMDRHINSADIHFIKNSQDPRPYKHLQRYYPLAAALRKYRLMRAK